MKKVLFTLIFLLVSFVGFSQKGLSYQAVILDPNKFELPGQDISGQPFVNGEVWLKFSIYNGTLLQFEEVQKTKTDDYGLVNLLIGSVSSASFNALVWDATQKSMKVHVSFNQGSSYSQVSDQKLNYNPYTFYADAAGKLNGTLAIAGGGTGATTAADARANLGLDQVNNTSDAAKPVSTATKTALDLKANSGDVNSGLALKANTLDVITALAAKADTGIIKTYVDMKVAAVTIADADASTKGKIQLAGDLSGTAAAPTVPGLALKANTADVTTALDLKANATDMSAALAAKADTGIIKTFVVTQVAAATIPDAEATTKGKIKLAGDLGGTAEAPTVPGLTLKLNTSEKGVANGIATLNSSGIIPSNQLPPVTLSSTSVVASDAAMVALSNATVGSIAVRTDVNKNYVLSALPSSTLANWIELLTPGAPVQTVNGYTGSINLVKSDIGLANVDNTSDVNKQVSSATQTALNLKADTSSVRTALALKLNIADANAALNLKLDANKVGVANGTASLNALGKIPTDQIPAISFSSVKVLSSQADMLALSTAVVGSVVIRTDVNKNYVLAQADPSVLTNWIELLTPAPPVQTVNGYTGSVSLTKSDVGLANADNTSDVNKPISSATQIALDAKPSRDFITSAISTGTATNTADIIALKTTVIANTQSITATNVALAQKALLFKPLKNAEYVMPTSGTIADANSGNIIYSQWSQKPVFPESLSDGFYCTIVNYSGGAITSNTLSAARFYTNTSGYAGATTFTIPVGGSANVYALKINGAQRYYVSAGDQSAALSIADGVITNAKLAGSITSSKLVGTDITALGTVTTGTWSGTSIALTKGGTGANSAAGARINLGLEIGTNVMAANATTTLSGDVTGTGSGTFTTTLSNTGVIAGTFGSASTIPAITVDQKGRITAASSFPISAGISSLLYTSATSYAAGGTISGTTLYLSAADASNPGLLSTSNQTIVGSKTFSSNVVANGTNVGKGSGGSSTVLGDAASANDNSTAIGFMALNGNGGTNNTAVGTNAMRNSSSTSYTTAVGVIAGQNDNSGGYNTFVGYAASVPNSSAISNSTAIGARAIVTASNTIQLGADGSNGSTPIQNVKTSGTLTAGTVTYPNAHGTANQVLSTTGSGTLTWTTPASVTLASLLGTQAANTFLAGPQTNLVTLASYDGSTLAGWTTSGAGITSDAGTGNPSSSFKTTGGNQFMYRSIVGQNFRNKTIQFDVKLTSGKTGINIGTAENAGTGGLGLTLFAGTNSRNGFTGSQSWLYTDDGGDTYTFTPGTWYTIKIITDNGAVGGTSWYVNGALVGTSGGYGMGAGSYFGIASDNGTAHFDNLTISGASNASDAVPTFRALVPADFPTLNQNTTGNAATATLATTASNVSGLVSGANGGTGVANTGKTITLGGNFETGHAINFTTTGSSTLALPVSGTLATVQQVDAKAPLVSPALTGTPTAPTATSGDNSTKIATTEFVQTAVSAGNAGLRTIGAISITSNAKGAVISGTSELVLTPADASNGGVVTTGTQTFAGSKTFANKLILNSGTPGGASLEVNGSSTNTTAFNAASGTSIDFTKSNLAYTTASAGNFTLTGMKDGGTYTLAVQGASSGTAVFTAAGFTLKSINNAATTANKHTLYTFIVMGTTVYYSMMTGL